MHKGWIGAAVVAVVVIAVLVLREPAYAPAPAEPAPPQPEQAVRQPVAGLNWKEVALPRDVGQAHRSAVDLEHAVFHVSLPDGTHRLADSDGVEHARGKSSLTTWLTGPRLVVHETNTGTVSSVNLSTGERTGMVIQWEPAHVVAAVAAVVVQKSEQCLTVLDAVRLETKVVHCAPEGWAISLLTAELDGVQWRESRPDGQCARWFRLEAPFSPAALHTGERSCRAAVLVRTADWELTADFPPYEVGVLNPGPLVARRETREITLDTSALDVHACGGRVYWLSKPAGAEQKGELVRWTPGDARVEVVAVGSGSASPSRCVNGVLNVVTYGDAQPRLWTLTDP